MLYDFIKNEYKLKKTQYYDVKSTNLICIEKI